MSVAAKLDQVIKLFEGADAGAKAFEGRAAKLERTPEIPIRSHFGSWRTISYRFMAPVKTIGFRAGYLCQCDCGTVRPVYEFQLRNGTSTSCGCKAGETAAATKLKKKRRAKV